MSIFDYIIFAFWMLTPDMVHIIKQHSTYVANISMISKFLLAGIVRVGQLFATKSILGLPHPPVWTTRFIWCEILVTVGQLYLSLDTMERLSSDDDISKRSYWKRLAAGVASSLAFDPLWYRSGSINEFRTLKLLISFGSFALFVAR